MLYLSGINYESIADGEGVRTTIFVSGCQHNCKNCWSPQTHNFTNGSPLTDELIALISKNINKRKFLNGITISGGDAMFSPLETIELINRIPIPNNNIWIYSGFTFEKIIQNEERFKLLQLCNVLIDGKFQEELKNITLKFRNSTNQRVIDVQKSIELNKIITL